MKLPSENVKACHLRLTPIRIRVKFRFHRSTKLPKSLEGKRVGQRCLVLTEEFSSRPGISEPRSCIFSLKCGISSRSQAGSKLPNAQHKDVSLAEKFEM